MFLVRKFFRRNEERLPDGGEPSCHPALKSNVVLSKVFSYLGVDELKSARQVSRQWIFTAEIIFRKKTSISFSFEDNVNIPPKRLKEFFQKSKRGVSLDSLTFRRGILPWTPAEVKEFFQKEGSIITEVRIDRILVQGEDQQNIDSFHPLTLLGENLLRNLKSLSIRGDMIETKFVIPLNLLENIEDLSFELCTIRIEGNKIRPRKLQFICNAFVVVHRPAPDENNGELEPILLNQFVDFDKLKELRIKSFYDISLVMYCGYHLDVVWLQNVMILDWENANWSIKRLTVSDVKLSGGRRNLSMKIKEVRLTAPNGVTVKSIRRLPPSLERLIIPRIAKSEEGAVLAQCQFGSLKHLLISIEENLLLTIFEWCPNLTQLEITALPLGQVLDANVISKSVRNIKLHTAVKLKGLNTSEVRFEKIIATTPDLNFLKELLETEDLQVLAVSKTFLVTLTSAMDQILAASATKNILLGDIQWNNHSYLNSQLSIHADKKSEYYSFENGEGKAISKYEFAKIANIELPCL